MANFYSVTAHAGTAVGHAAVGNFTRGDQTNLVVGRGTRVEVFTLTAEGLVGTASVPVYGRVSALALFRPRGLQTDLALVCTERYRCFVLGWDARADEPATLSSGDVRDRVGRPVDVGHIAAVDPSARVAALHLYDGFLKVMALGDGGRMQDAFSLRLEELRVVDVQFLHRCERPTVVLVYADAKDTRHAKTYEYVQESHELRRGAWALPNVEAGSSFVIPVVLGGGVIVGEQSVTYSRMTHADGKPLTVPIPGGPVVVRAYGRVDRTRFLLGDHLGRLYMLTLVLDERAERVVDIRVALLGVTSIASTISYLDNGVVFIGSSLGDSQTVQISPDGRSLEVLDSFPSTGPITDLVVVDLDHRGQGQVVACSGAFKDGALSVVRNGVGVTELSSVDAPGAQQLWSLQTDAGSGRFLVISYEAIGTQVLELREASLGLSSINGLVEKESTLHCGTSASMNRIVQIVRSGVRLIDCSPNRAGVLASWAPPGTATIKVASCGVGCRHVLVSLGQKIVYLEAAVDAQGEITGFSEVSSCDFGAEIACADVGSTTAADPSVRPRICAVGTWDMNLRLLSLPELKVVCTERLEGDAVPHSVMLAELDAGPEPSAMHLLCGTGDGQLFAFVVAGAAAEAASLLQDKKKYSLGTGNVRLRAVRTRGRTSIFAASNRPAVIYSPAGTLHSSGGTRKLLTSNVNLRELSDVCAFGMQEEDADEGLALLTEGRLVLGIVDEIQKLHVRKCPLKEMPRRIAFQEETRQFAVLSVLTLVGENGLEIEKSRVKLFDEQLADTRAEFPLEDNEAGCSLAALHFADDPQPYFVVGTARIVPMEAEPTAGRIIVLRVAGGAFEVVAEKDVKGAVYSLDVIAGKLLASVNTKVHIFTWSESQQPSMLVAAPAVAAAAERKQYTRSLIAHCEHQGHILALKVATLSDELVAVGDLMKSVSLLAYKPVEQRLEEVARDFEPGWVSSICPVADDTILVAENSFNLYTLVRNSETASEEERGRLLIAGEYHLGEFVNVFRRGSLVMRQQPQQQQMEVDTEAPQTFIWGSASGAIGVLARITDEQYAFLLALQDALNKVIVGVGGITHDHWRSFSSERKSEQARGFIDGDLIESFLDLRPSKMAEVVAKIAGYQVSVEDVCKRIEALQRATH